MELARPAIAHVALTVSDLDASVAWYSSVFDVEPALVGSFLADTEHAYSAAIWITPSFGLHHFADPAAGSFDPRRPGLDHVAFACSSIDELEGWRGRLDVLEIPHGNILTEWYGAGLAFVDPDGVALEVFCLSE